MKTNIEMCVIGRKSKQFEEQLIAIKKIQGVKVLKRRNKPFYDIKGCVDDNSLNAMAEPLSTLISDCGAVLEIGNSDLRQEIFRLIERG